MKIKSRDCSTNILLLCKTNRLNGVKVIHATPNQLRRRGEVYENSCTQKKIRGPFVRTIHWNFVQKKKLAKSPIGIVRAQLRVDPKHMELQSELHDD